MLSSDWGTLGWLSGQVVTTHSLSLVHPRMELAWRPSIRLTNQPPTYFYSRKTFMIALRPTPSFSSRPTARPPSPPRRIYSLEGKEANFFITSIQNLKIQFHFSDRSPTHPLPSPPRLGLDEKLRLRKAATFSAFSLSLYLKSWLENWHPSNHSSVTNHEKKLMSQQPHQLG